MNILFLCTGNSCRSILAEALLNHLAPKGLSAQSAGSHPVGVVNPKALATLIKHGIPTQDLRSKSWDSLTLKPEVVITLCAEAAGETCPVFLGQAVRVHWGMPDPAKVEGDESTIEAAFEETFTALKNRLTTFLEVIQATPGLSGDRLKFAMESIA